MNLEEENNKLKAKLAHAQDWMQKEISQKLVQENTSFVEERIYKFFPPEVLSYFPENGIANITSSEIIYSHMLAGEQLDGMGVIIGYQKTIDEMVELYITKSYRKYVKKHFSIHSPQNIALEKSLHSIVSKGYTLSLGRLYNLLENIKLKKDLPYYSSIFFEYLKSRKSLYKSLLETDFLLQLKSLVDLHVIAEKRHSGSLSQKDTTIARRLFIGDFKNNECLLYTLASSQNIDI